MTRRTFVATLGAVALAFSAVHAAPWTGCGASIGPISDSGHASSSNTGQCFPNASQAGRSARFNLDTIVLSANEVECDASDCVSGSCAPYVTYNTSGQPVISTYQDPPGSGCWKATSAYVTGTVTMGCSACNPL